jgi:hypothetical protein
VARSVCIVGVAGPAPVSFFVRRSDTRMLAFILAVVLLALSAWGGSATVRGLRQTNAGGAWWLAFTVLGALGAGVGAWFAFRFEYQVSHDFRFAGFPVPVAFFHLEGGDWVDFIIPPCFAYPGLLADISTFAAVLLSPLLAARRITERRRPQ